MVGRHTFFLLLFLFNSLSFFAQEKTGNTKLDSLLTVLPSIKIDTVRVNTLNLIAKAYKNVNPNQGIIFGNKALGLAKKIKWNEGVAISLIHIGNNNAILGKYEIAQKSYTQALFFTKNKLNEALIYMGHGDVMSNNGNFPKALEYFFKSLKISENIKNSKEIARNYVQIGNVYNNILDSENCLKYYNKALKIYNNLKDKRQISHVLQNIGSLYYDENKDSLAFIYLQKSLKISEEINDKQGIVFVNLYLGELFFRQNNNEKALEHNIIAKDFAIEINDSKYIFGSKALLAKICIKMFSVSNRRQKNNLLLDKAEEALVDAVKICKESGNLLNLSFCYKTQSNLFELKNDFKKSKELYIEYITLRDSVYNADSNETIKNLEDQRTIDLKNKEIQINKITLESKEKQKWFYILGIGFLCILGSLLFYQSRSRKKRNQQLQVLNSELDQANKSKVKFLSILNHDLRSPVYNFIHFMQLQKDSPELLDAETKKSIETKTINSAENLLGSMEDLLLWSKGQMENFKPQSKNISANSLFEDTKNHFASEEKVQMFFENPSNLKIITDENYLKTIIRNLTSNAIKALTNIDNSSIIWKAWQENNVSYLSITDNGKGASKEQFKALYDTTEVIGIKTGLGLHLIRDLAKAINCEITVDSKINERTSFVLKF